MEHNIHYKKFFSERLPSERAYRLRTIRVRTPYHPLSQLEPPGCSMHLRLITPRVYVQADPVIAQTWQRVNINVS